MNIIEQAQAEADKRWPADHTVDDPFGETGEARSDPYGYDETANRAFVQGAEWALRYAATGLIDWEVIYGHSPSDTRTDEAHGIAAWLESQADPSKVEQ